MREKSTVQRVFEQAAYNSCYNVPKKSEKSLACAAMP